jgi:hypothetical protein
MNIGNLDDSNNKFIKNYKKLGYPTMTSLIEAAITLLRNQKEAELRKGCLLEAAKAYEESYAWQALDGDDFNG